MVRNTHDLPTLLYHTRVEEEIIAPDNLFYNFVRCRICARRIRIDVCMEHVLNHSLRNGECYILYGFNEDSGMLECLVRFINGDLYPGYKVTPNEPIPFCDFRMDYRFLTSEYCRINSMACLEKISGARDNVKFQEFVRYYFFPGELQHFRNCGRSRLF